MNRSYFISLIAGFVACALQAADNRMKCEARGKAVSVYGGGLVSGTADITFTESMVRGDRVLNNISGHILTANTLGDEDEYEGRFAIASLSENPKYRPRRYKGFSQFPKFDAAKGNGPREEGMWGQFLLEKNTARPRFSAHYIFQAGDHMGGVLHLSCWIQP